MDFGGFDGLFTKPRPHILEKICLSLDYNTFKNCLVMSRAWKTVLTATTFQKKAKSVFKEEILEDEEKLRKNSLRGQTKAVKKLLSIALLDVDFEDQLGQTPLYSAAKKGHKDVVRLLLDSGADPNKANNYGNTPLHWAAYKGHKDMVQLLLDRWADPNKAGHFGWTPLHYAAKNGHTVVLQLLLDSGADRDLTNDEEKTPLQMADKDVVVNLLKRQ